MVSSMIEINNNHFDQCTEDQLNTFVCWYCGSLDTNVLNGCKDVDTATVKCNSCNYESYALSLLRIRNDYLHYRIDYSGNIVYHLMYGYDNDQMYEYLNSLKLLDHSLAILEEEDDDD